MGRTWALGLAIAGLVGAAGCSQSGSYRLSWVFLVDSSTGATQSAAVGCGQHGIDSILANGVDGNGDTQRIIALCVPGAFNGAAQPGTWTFTFQMLDAGGLPLHPVYPPLNSPNAIPPLAAVSAPPASIAAGAPPAEFAVELTPLPGCNYGIGNGCDAGTPAAQDGGTARDGAPREGGTAGTNDGGSQDGGSQDGGSQDGGPLDGGPLDARG